MDRLKRTHVVTVRNDGKHFYVFLSDGSKITWDMWTACGGKI